MQTEFKGIDLSSLVNEQEKVYYPETVPGRIVQIDADFLAYMCCFDETKTISDMQHNAQVASEKLRLMAGAEKMVLHLTPRGSNKGDRYNISLLKEYQGNRKDKPKPRFLHMIRDYMHKELGAIRWDDAEADDGMAMCQYNMIQQGYHNLSVIASKDKDLQMVPGLSLDWDTGEITDTKDNPYGWIILDRNGSTPKIKGRGWKFFWSQMLTGDPADNISGLPKMWDIDKEKFTTCGAVKCFNRLEHITSNIEAYALVKALYKEYSEKSYMDGTPPIEEVPYNKPYVNYRNGSYIPWQEAFISEAKLLWMRRSKDSNDVIKWLQETCV